VASLPENQPPAFTLVNELHSVAAGNAITPFGIPTGLAPMAAGGFSPAVLALGSLPNEGSTKKVDPFSVDNND
jgi:hypothetical protein